MNLFLYYNEEGKWFSASGEKQLMKRGELESKGFEFEKKPEETPMKLFFSILFLQLFLTKQIFPHPYFR